MNHRTIIGCVTLMGLGSTVALAQNTLGELLDAGGKKLSKEEVVTALSGAHVTGTTKQGGQQEFDYKADGSLSGNIQTAQGHGVGISGTWTVDNNGRLCTESYSTGKKGKRDEICNFYFVKANQYYESHSDSDKSSLILTREVKK